MAAGALLIDLLLDLVTHKRTHLESSLRGVDGYTGRGDIAFSAWPNGKRKLAVELRGIAGRIAEVYADGALAATIDLNDGRAGQTLDTKHGDTVPHLAEGAHIDVRQNGQIILEGEFSTE